MYYLVYFNTLKNTAPPSHMVRIYKSLGGMIGKPRSLFKRYLRKFKLMTVLLINSPKSSKGIKKYFFIQFIASLYVCACKMVVGILNKV